MSDHLENTFYIFQEVAEEMMRLSEEDNGLCLQLRNAWSKMKLEKKINLIFLIMNKVLLPIGNNVEKSKSIFFCHCLENFTYLKP